MGRPPSSMAKFADVLEENWYDTLESLKTVEDEFWTTHKFPARLVSSIKEELGGGSSSPPVSTPTQKPKPVA